MTKHYSSSANALYGDEIVGSDLPPDAVPIDDIVHAGMTELVASGMHVDMAMNTYLRQVRNRQVQQAKDALAGTDKLVARAHEDGRDASQWIEYRRGLRQVIASGLAEQPEPPPAADPAQPVA